MDSNAPGSVSHVAADAAVVAAVDPGRVSASSGSEIVIWKFWSFVFSAFVYTRTVNVYDDERARNLKGSLFKTTMHPFVEYWPMWTWRSGRAHAFGDEGREFDPGSIRKGFCRRSRANLLKRVLAHIRSNIHCICCYTWDAKR